jgi:hypothetical protein
MLGGNTSWSLPRAAATRGPRLDIGLERNPMDWDESGTAEMKEGERTCANDVNANAELTHVLTCD